MTTPSSVLVVGAGLAGMRCAETLRTEGYGGKLVLVGDELLPPYERPALSKEYLAGTKAEDELLLRASSSWVEREIELRLGQRVVHVDAPHRSATTAGGEELGWDVLVLATGARPRLLPFPVPEGVFALRTVADARMLRAALVPGTHLVVVGGGFIGAEVASTAIALGVQVTMLEALATPFERTLGSVLGGLLADRYRTYGIDLRVRTGATGFGAGPDGAVRSVRLTDGSEIRCDVALVGVGVEPAAELLAAAAPGVPVYPCGRRDGRARTLDKRLRRGRSRRSADPRTARAARAACVLLVGPVRPSAPARRPRVRHSHGHARRRRGELCRPLPG